MLSDAFLSMRISFCLLQYVEKTSIAISVSEQVCSSAPLWLGHEKWIELVPWVKRFQGS